jgi:hypothetical protein
MACFLAEEVRIQRRINKNIDRQLLRDKKEMKRELKLLLLGTGESGKSTFIKQMRIIHGSGYSDEDRIQFTTLVYRNIYISIQSLIKAMEQLKIPFHTDGLGSCTNRLSSVQIDNVQSISDNDKEDIRRIWADPGTQECYKNRREFQLSDSTKYYLDDFDRIAAEDYVPTTQDVLRVRIPTTGIIEYHFDIRNIVFRLVVFTIMMPAMRMIVLGYNL